MIDQTSPHIRERASIEVIDHSTIIPRRVREIDTVMVDGQVVSRVERDLPEGMGAALQRLHRWRGWRGVAAAIWAGWLRALWIRRAGG